MYCSEETSLFSCNREKKGTEKERGGTEKERGGRERKEREKKMFATCIYSRRMCTQERLSH